MICIDILILQQMGVPDTDIVGMRADFRRTGVMPCYCFSFDAGGEGIIDGRSPKEWLECEAESPELLLIGGKDTYGTAKKQRALVTEMCIHEDGVRSRPLNPDEAAALPGLFQKYGWSESALALARILPHAQKIAFLPEVLV